MHNPRAIPFSAALIPVFVSGCAAELSTSAARERVSADEHGPDSGEIPPSVVAVYDSPSVPCASLFLSTVAHPLCPRHYDATTWRPPLLRPCGCGSRWPVSFETVRSRSCAIGDREVKLCSESNAPTALRLTPAAIDGADSRSAPRVRVQGVSESYRALCMGRRIVECLAHLICFLHPN